MTVYWFWQTHRSPCGRQRYGSVTQGPTVFRKTYHSTHPDSMAGASTQQLRDRYLVQNLFVPDPVTLDYSRFERFVIGGAMVQSKSVRLPEQTEPASAKGKPFLERREHEDRHARASRSHDARSVGSRGRNSTRCSQTSSCLSGNVAAADTGRQS